MRSAPIALVCMTLVAQNSPLDKEAALGKQFAEELRRSTTPVEPTAVRDYVAQLGASLVFQLPSRTFTYAFSIVETDRTNALHEPLALPGGYIFVPLNLLFAAESEAQFAGILAQAIARGPLRIAGNAGAITLIFMGGRGDDALLPAAALDQRRDVELKADAAAALVMSRAGFDPTALLRYIERVQPPDRPRSPFPPRAARIAALQGIIRELPFAAYPESETFHAVQELARSAQRPPKQSRPSLLRNTEPAK